MIIEGQTIQGRIIVLSKRGWGFISSKDIEFTRIFFHWTSLKQDTIPFLELKTGMIVEFIPSQLPNRGWRAIQIRVIERKKDADTQVKDGTASTESSGTTEERNEENDSASVVPTLQE